MSFVDKQNSGRWMQMITIPNQSPVAKAYQEFDDVGRMRASPYYDRIVDVMEELVKFIHLTRDLSVHLINRYSECHESAQQLQNCVDPSKAVP